MQKKIEIEAATDDEALKLAVEKFHISAENIFINSIGDNKYEALVDVDLALVGKKYIEGILKAFGVDYQIEVRRVGDEEIHYVIESNENPVLIGSKGRTLDALNTLLKNIIGTYTKERLVITLDVGSYRSSRERQLEILATKTAKEVKKVWQNLEV